MSHFPSPSLVAKVEALIYGTFEVSAEQAHDYACGIVALAEDWGSPEKASKLDWSHRVKKDFGEKLPWKSEDERQKFRAEQEQAYRSYEALISKNKSRPII